MKQLQSMVLCMKNHEIRVDLVDLFPSDEYPNTPDYGYHDFYEMELFLSGRGMHEINAVPYRVKRGFVYLLFPGDFHRHQMDEDERMVMCNLKLAPKRVSARMRDRLRGCRHPYAAYLDEEALSQMNEELMRLRTLLEEHPVDTGLCDNVIERILLLLSRALVSHAPVRDTVPETTGVEKILSYLEEHYPEHVSMVTLASLVGLSPNYFGTYFKTHTGMTPVEYLTRLRLCHAAELLKSTREKVKTIARNTGFHSPEYFTRVFRDAFGLTPAQYRESLQ